MFPVSRRLHPRKQWLSAFLAGVLEASLRRGSGSPLGGWVGDNVGLVGSPVSLLASFLIHA